MGWRCLGLRSSDLSNSRPCPPELHCVEPCSCPRMEEMVCVPEHLARSHPAQCPGSRACSSDYSGRRWDLTASMIIYVTRAKVVGAMFTLPCKFWLLTCSRSGPKCFAEVRSPKQEHARCDQESYQGGVATGDCNEGGLHLCCQQARGVSPGPGSSCIAGKQTGDMRSGGAGRR